MKILSLLLTLTIIINIKCEFTIEALLNYLQENGIYDLLAEIKLYLGEDVTIMLCKTFVETIHCEEVVRIYITNPANARAFDFFEDDDYSIPEKEYKEDNIPEEPLNIKEKFTEIINKYSDTILSLMGPSGMDTLKKNIEIFS